MNEPTTLSTTLLTMFNRCSQRITTSLGNGNVCQAHVVLENSLIARLNTSCSSAPCKPH